MAAARPRRARPLASMTGYGRGRAANRWAEAEAELRSVNGKSLHVAVRLPAERLEWEAEVEAALRAAFERGSVQGSVRVRWRETPAASLDHAALKHHARAWRAAAKELGAADAEPALRDLLALPGVWRGAEESAAAAAGARKAALAALAEAIVALRAGREREGAKLCAELRALTAEVARGLAAVRARLPEARAEAERRLKERVTRALAAAGVSEPPDVAREVVLAAERGDVEEECARLQIHLGRVEALLAGGGACGRELEFQLQECQREVTTLGNKSSDAALSAAVVAMKSAVQRLREQAANVE
jgi:uncharacterized protein (TIGR00255 family)